MPAAQSISEYIVLSTEVGNTKYPAKAQVFCNSGMEWSDYSKVKTIACQSNKQWSKYQGECSMHI